MIGLSKGPDGDGRQLQRFAHETEERFAHILDFYDVPWEYEPVEFALEWDERGRRTAGFRPDFWLPDPGLFVEVTALDQRLVTKKRQKVRRVAALYPDVRVTLLYQRDMLALLSTYGLAGVDPGRPAVSRSA
ncbi:MAG: PDDEXK family nuclease [Acidimicrobiales bacterium]